jgi:hypothetical protein
MDLFKINVKIPVVGGDAAGGDIVAIFHRWIQDQALADHLLIDVADYDHVHDGPGTILIASEANIHLDHGQGQPGLLYVRKRPIIGADTLVDRLRYVLNAARTTAARLEREPELAGRLHFSTDELWIQSNDRLAAPNSDAGFAAMRSAITSVAEGLGGGPATVERVANSPQELLKIRVVLPALNPIPALA